MSSRFASSPFIPARPRRNRAALRAVVVALLAGLLLVGPASAAVPNPTTVLPPGARPQPAAAIGTVSARVYRCPAGLGRADAERAAQLATVLAACALLDDEQVTLRLANAAGGPAEAGHEVEPGVSLWEGLPFATYLLSEARKPAGFGSRLVTDERGQPLADQRTVAVRVDGGTRHPERSFYYFTEGETTAGGPARGERPSGGRCLEPVREPRGTGGACGPSAVADSPASARS